MTTLRGKHALVTGGSRGIGRGIALGLAAEGARVAVHYYRNEAAAKDTLDRVRKHGADGVLVQADVSRPDEVRRMFAEVKGRFGSLDRSRWRSPSRPGTTRSTPRPRPSWSAPARPPRSWAPAAASSP
jgi:hypothetical protein